MASGLPAGIKAAADVLELAWKTDSRTREVGFPAITLSGEFSRPHQACPTAGFAAPQALALYCPDRRQIVIDPKRLEILAVHYGTWDVAFWLATALGQAILVSSGQSSGHQADIVVNLQALCFGGTLLGQAQGLKRAVGRYPLSSAFIAFPAGLNGSQGTPAQRTYALLSGLGGTASDCNGISIANLVAGKVPDPQRLQALASPPVRSTGSGAIEAVINSLCLPKPPLGCPRRLPQLRVRSNP